MMTCISTAQARTKCGSRFCDPTGPQHFTCKFPYEVALLTCWPAFRLRGLAQSVCLRSGHFLFCGILPVNFCKKWLFWNVDVHLDYAGSHKVCVCVLGSFWYAAFFPVNFRTKWLFWTVDVDFDCRVSVFWAHSGLRHFTSKILYKVALVTCWRAFRLRRLAQSVGPVLGSVFLLNIIIFLLPYKIFLLPYIIILHLFILHFIFRISPSSSSSSSSSSASLSHHHHHHLLHHHHHHHHHRHHHHHHHPHPHPHYHTLSFHPPTLFGVSCRDNF